MSTLKTFKCSKKSAPQKTTIPDQTLEIVESEILAAQNELNENGIIPEPLLLAKILSRATVKH